MSGARRSAICARAEALGRTQTSSAPAHHHRHRLAWARHLARRDRLARSRRLAHRHGPLSMLSHVHLPTSHLPASHLHAHHAWPAKNLRHQRHPHLSKLHPLSKHDLRLLHLRPLHPRLPSALCAGDLAGSRKPLLPTRADGWMRSGSLHALASNCVSAAAVLLMLPVLLLLLPIDATSAAAAAHFFHCCCTTATGPLLPLLHNNTIALNSPCVTILTRTLHDQRLNRSYSVPTRN